MNEQRTYQSLCPQGTPEAVRRKYNIGDVFLNQARCLKCGDVITSSHRHDFVWCNCKSLAVDGGSAYTKRLFNKMDEWEEMSISYEQDVANNVE